MKTTSFTLADGTAVNWSTAVVGGAAAADVYATASEDGHSQTKLWARAGQPITAARLRDAQYDELPVAVRSSTGTLATALDTVNAVGDAIRYLPLAAAGGTIRGAKNLGDSVVLVAVKGSDTINGGTGAYELEPGETAKFVSDGAGGWTDASQNGTYAPILNVHLLAWAYAQAFRVVSASRDSNGAITTASIVWPDASTGTFTTDTASSAFPGAIDAYHVTYVNAATGTKTVTQTAVTRDPTTGAVTAQPALTVA